MKIIDSNRNYRPVIIRCVCHLGQPDPSISEQKMIQLYVIFKDNKKMIHGTDQVTTPNMILLLIPVTAMVKEQSGKTGIV